MLQATLFLLAMQHLVVKVYYGFCLMEYS